MKRLFTLLLWLGILCGVPITSLQAQDEFSLDPKENLYKKDRLRDLQTSKQRSFPTNQIPRNWQFNAIEHLRKKRFQANTSIEPFTSIGPNSVQVFDGPVFWSGRAVSVASDPEDPATAYIGTGGGGIWKTTDAGQSWKCLTADLPVQSVGAIAIDPTNPKIVYAGTGDSRLFFTSFSGIGILKSTDSGQTWQVLASDTFTGSGFRRLVIHPQNPRILYAVAGRASGGISRSLTDNEQNGIFQSTDGGQTWKNLLPSTVLFSGGAELKMDFTNPSVLFAAQPGVGFFKTTNAGQTWTPIPQLKGEKSRLSVIAIATSDPKILYASTSEGSTSKLKLYKSTDGGANWVMLRISKNSPLRKQPEVPFLLETDPSNANIVYIGAFRFFRSTDGGATWSPPYPMHADIQAMSHSKKDPKYVYLVNDGGAHISTDGGNTFTPCNSDLNTLQFYTIAVHPTNPNIAIGGTQDNQAELYGGNLIWNAVFGGDVGFTAIDPASPETMIIYVTPLRWLARSKQGGKPRTWEILEMRTRGIPATPALFYPAMVMDPNKSKTLYFGGGGLYCSTDQGESWKLTHPALETTGLVSVIAIAPGNSDVIYLGYTNGKCYISRNRGGSFEPISDGLPVRYISDIAVDPQSPETLYVSISGFHSGHIYKSTNGGKNWKDISGMLPDVPANTVLLNPQKPSEVLLGTDIGVFVSADEGQTWAIVPGLPIVPVFDLAGNTNVGIFAATHGRGVFRSNPPARKEE